MLKDDKEAKKEELLEKKEACKLTEEELEQVTGGVALISGDDAAGISKGYKPVFPK